MKKRGFLFIVLLSFILSIFSCVGIKAGAAELPEVNIRVEGITGTIAEGKAQGATVEACLTSFLNERSIENNISGGWIQSIAGLQNPQYGENNYWGYICKDSSGTYMPENGVDKQETKGGETYVVYYGDWKRITFVNSIEFSPQIPREGSECTITFSENGWNGKVPVKNALVRFDDSNYITDDNGKITISEMKTTDNGQHPYMISGYETNITPSVVMDKGIFTIDGIHSPSIDYNPDNYDKLDNSGIQKDIPAEIKALTEYLSGNNDNPWTAVTLSRFGIKAGESYLKESGDFINEYGIENMSNTDLEKLILNLTSTGYTPYSFDGKDLVKELLDRDINGFLNNDSIFALIVYHNVGVKNQYKITDTVLTDKILKSAVKVQKGTVELTGWNLQGSDINPDMTGAALSALAPYNDEKHPEVQQSIQKAVVALSELQTENGYLPDSDGIFSESLSYAITGLAAVGVNPEGVQFTKLKGDLISALLSFKGTAGQYKHSLTGGNDYVATQQALMALYSYNESKK
ncbi:MAG: hypothetical protein Q8930_17540, partial [Bacillota bacterium]|nr:hypothetical protein [Bacillota bacterium]